MDKLLSITIDVDTVSTLFPDIADRNWRDKTFRNGVERFLKLFKKFDIKATFFLVGNDLKDEGNIAIVREIIAEDHEVANHTMNHIQSLHKLPHDEILSEVGNAEDIIKKTTGVAVCGFRAPGWNVSKKVLHILEERNYKYDSSVFPTFIMPIAKGLHYAKTKDVPPIRRSTMGSITNMFAPRKLYNPINKKNRNSSEDLIEYPLTTVPYLRLPFFGTMVFEYGLSYFDLFYRLVTSQKLVNFSLHLAELCDKDNDFDSAILNQGVNKGYVPKCLNVSIDEKVELFETIFSRFKRDFDFVTMKEAVEY